jgi:hypothetical protein
MDLFIYGLFQSGLLCQPMYGPNTAIREAAGAIGDLVMDVARGEHGSALLFPVDITEPILNSLLAALALFCYFRFHSKCLLASEHCF